MNIITPITVTAAMIGAGTTIAEPAAGETAWVSAGTYALADLRIRTTTHRVYKCVQAHTGRTALPEDDSAYWLDYQPTQKWAPFDVYTSTAATTVTTMTYVLTPGYFNAVALYGLTGNAYTLTVKDVTGGTTIYSSSGYLYDAPIGWYEYLFGTVVAVRKLVFTEIPIRPAAELTLTITAATGEAVGLGMLVCGDYVPLHGYGDWGGVQYGASAEPVTYSYIRTDEYGTTTIVRRHSATNLRVSVALPRDQADGALQAMQSVLDVPVAWIATDSQGYSGLSTFGIGSGSMNYDSYGTANFEINVKGLV